MKRKKGKKEGGRTWSGKGLAEKNEKGKKGLGSGIGRAEGILVQRVNDWPGQSLVSCCCLHILTQMPSFPFFVFVG
jgi:hypothetical protein